MFVPDLAVDPAGFDEADLQPGGGLAEAHKHCSGTVAERSEVFNKTCHYGRGVNPAERPTPVH
jgi:hypothetical protein